MHRVGTTGNYWFQVELFLIAIEMNPPKVQLQGYTVVNRELVTSVSFLCCTSFNKLLIVRSFQLSWVFNINLNNFILEDKIFLIESDN